LPWSVSRINADNDIREEIKRAIHMGDEELLQEILDIKPELANLQIDKERNV
jgi:hypothetical protein